MGSQASKGDVAAEGNAAAADAAAVKTNGQVGAPNQSVVFSLDREVGHDKSWISLAKNLICIQFIWRWMGNDRNVTTFWGRLGGAFQHRCLFLDELVTEMQEHF